MDKLFVIHAIRGCIGIVVILSGVRIGELLVVAFFAIVACAGRYVEWLFAVMVRLGVQIR